MVRWALRDWTRASRALLAGYLGMGGIRGMQYALACIALISDLSVLGSVRGAIHETAGIACAFIVFLHCFSKSANWTSAVYQKRLPL
eukprot:15431563-Alexandrium_andersonii.AAC.1